MNRSYLVKSNFGIFCRIRAFVADFTPDQEVLPNHSSRSFAIKVEGHWPFHAAATARGVFLYKGKRDLLTQESVGVQVLTLLLNY